MGRSSIKKRQFCLLLQQFDEFDRMMNKAIHMSEITLLPHLKNVKRLAEDYKNLGKQ